MSLEKLRKRGTEAWDEEDREDVAEAITDALGDNSLGAAAGWVATHLKLVAILVFALLFVILAVGWKISRDRQNELRQQIDRQNELIEALENKVDDQDSKKSIPVITSETLKSELGALQELVTQEYVYTNADKREQDAKWIFGWSRPLSKSSLLITYDGTIKAGIDMSEVQVEVNEERRTITVTLPASKITDNNIPQESITVVEVKDGLFNEVTFDDYNTFISEQKIIMENKAIERGLLEEADEEARNAIKAFLSVMPAMTGENAYTLEIN